MEPITGKRENIHPFGSTAIHDVPSGTSFAEQSKEKAADLAQQVKDRAADAMGAVKEGYHQLGERLEEGGEYLREQAERGLEETTGLIRRNPVPALLISFCAGFFLCRLLKD